jgi:ABC-2 type transport system ATP-binding protein
VSSPALEVEGLRKSFKVRRPLGETLRRPFQGATLTALDGLSCRVAEGEFFGLLGVNGAGKTTFFKILSTLVNPDGGTASVFGIDVARDPARIRELVAPVLTSERSLYWRLSAAENLRLFAALHRLPGSPTQRVNELLRLVGLAEVGARLVGTFSSGMKQRLLLARALLARPRLLLLDEPTRSLDPIAARDFRDFLRKEIGRAQGCTVLLATHDADEVRDLCDRVGVLHRGKLVAMGTTQTLAAQLNFHRYRLVTTEPSHPAIEALAGDGVHLNAPGGGGDQWQVRELDLPGGPEAAAAIVARLSRAGVPVARFEQVELPLAELIQRLGSGPGSLPHA